MPQQDSGARNVIGLDAARQERVRAPQRGGDIARRVGELERDMANLVADLALQRYQQADAIASVRRESLREAEAPAALPSIDDIATAVAREVRVALRDEMRELLREIVAETRGAATPVAIAPPPVSDPPTLSAPLPEGHALHARALTDPQGAVTAPTLAGGRSLGNDVLAGLLESTAPAVTPVVRAPETFAPGPTVDTPAIVEMPEIVETAVVVDEPPAVDVTPEEARVEPTLPVADAFTDIAGATQVGLPSLRELQVVISPIRSFSQLLDIEMPIRALGSVIGMQLTDFRNGAATFAISVAEAISAAEFGTAIQMLGQLHLRLEGHTASSVELRLEEPAASS